MRNRIISGAMIVTMGVSLYVVQGLSSEEDALAMLSAVDALSAAESRVTQSAFLLSYDGSVTFDTVHEALGEAYEALDVLEETTTGSGSLARHAAQLRTYLAATEEHVMQLLTRAGGARNGRHGVASYLNSDAESLSSNDIPLLSTWLAFSLVPSDENLTALQRHLESDEPVAQDAVSDLRSRGRLLSLDESESRQRLSEILSVPMRGTVAQLRRDAEREAQRAGIRSRWLGILAIVLVGGLGFLVQNLVGRLETSRNIERRMKEDLEEAVTERTHELQLANEQLATDIDQRKKAEAERDRMEVDLRHAQKLEAVGRLAAGIAHEINTPAQYVSDNTLFLKDAFDDVMTVVHQAKVVAGHEDSESRENSSVELKAKLEAVDITFLETEVPSAIHQCIDGLNRVASIVSAMKEFSHPGREKALVNLNDALTTTLAIARNEWKYVAEIETVFDETLPMVPCIPGEVNQVFLNIIVNAAHAIADVLTAGDDSKGTITIRTLVDAEHAVVTIADTGSGISEEVRGRIFDPFFTTKDVGKGTGQGLAIAYSVIHEKHHGDISVDSTPGAGTVFTIRLPLTEVAEVEEVGVDEQLASVSGGSWQIE